MKIQTLEDIIQSTIERILREEHPSGAIEKAIYESKLDLLRTLLSQVGAYYHREENEP